MTREAQILLDYLKKCETSKSFVNPAEEFLKEHPTNQQAMIAFMIDVMLEMSSAPSDARNESAISFCKKVVALTTPRDRAMPYI